ncbi:glycine cleavage H-protein-domain-containing protein [Sparassis latifolia]|uniref:Glycine cleavage system H protein n=1 Tax=Sparassis crispa TaxID=139825 RepID=A0A401G6W0_9APHY|nr:Putative glycine cleavage system H protein [Sparassis crispa]GBE77894.1 Putative glycine cleavage system H protein [Sparassis crispa]
MFPALRQGFRSTSLRAARRPAVSAPFRASPFVRTLVTKRYTQDHEAVAFDDATMTGTVYITDYAQSSLGDVVFVELPTEGTEVTQGDQIGAVESVKAASDIYAPISGTVEAVNTGLADKPGLLNQSPEDKGWLCKIKVKDAAEIDSLMEEAAYKAHCES